MKIDSDLKLVSINLDYAKNIFKAFDEEVIKFLPLDYAPSIIEDTIYFIRKSLVHDKNLNH